MINLQKLKDSSDVCRFTAGNVIIKDGDTDINSMYIILQGSVNVYKNFGKPQQIKLATLTAGNFFGEMSLFLNNERTADVVATEKVTALKIDRINAYDFFETQPEATYSLVRSLCARIEEHNLKLAGDSSMEKSASAGLFPVGHKIYEFTIKAPEPKYVYAKKYQCPYCLNQFEKDVPRQSNLHLTKTDPDLRTYYNGIDPLFFEIITCPSCGLSALTAQFEKAKTSMESKLFEILTPFRGPFDFSGKIITDTSAMFAGFYLALKCAPVCFPGSDMVAARLWHRLSWLYGDCGDAEMSEASGTNALEAYINAYQNTDFQEEQAVRVSLIIAELSYRYGSIKTASEFFLKVKMNKQAGAVYQHLAEDRIDEIRKQPK